MSWQDEVNKKVDNMNSTRDYTSNYAAEDIEQNKVVSALTYFGITFWLPFVVCPESRFGRFHANQSLIALIFYVVVGIVGAVLSLCLRLVFGVLFMGGIGVLLGALIGIILNLVSLAVFLFGLLSTLSGKAKEIPIIGKLRLIK